MSQNECLILRLLQLRRSSENQVKECKRTQNVASQSAASKSKSSHLPAICTFFLLSAPFSFYGNWIASPRAQFQVHGHAASPQIYTADHHVSKLYTQLPANLECATPHEAERCHYIASCSPDDHTPVMPTCSLNDSPRDRDTRERTEADNSIARSVVSPVHIRIAELAYTNRREGNIRARCETEDDCVNNRESFYGCRLGLSGGGEERCGEPEHQ